jgi:zinc protease
LVREQQIASSVSVSYQLYDKYNTLFTLSFTPAKGTNNDTVLAAIKAQITELIKNPTGVSWFLDSAQEKTTYKKATLL